MSAHSVLVVDDDPRNVKLLVSLLASSGLEVRTAAHGEEACRMVTERRPDLILLDAMMPGMTGFEVLSWLRGRNDLMLLPVVMVTALNSIDEKVRALDLGADDFISKPINRLELQAKVRSLLRVHELQRALEEKNDALRRSEAMRESLTQMIVHDLKNPLTAIDGSIQLLSRKHLADRPEASRMAGSILRSCRVMMGMILDLLDVSRFEEGCPVVKPEPVALRELILSNIEECSAMARNAHVELSSEFPDTEPRAMADPGLVERIVANLLNNAIKHTPPGGRVVVSSRRREGWVEVAVRDTGEGIPAGESDRIFDKFARAGGQTRSTRHDRGLGLTFCRMAVEAHGGHIGVESAPQRGSVFTFTLPATAP